MQTLSGASTRNIRVQQASTSRRANQKIKKNSVAAMVLRELLGYADKLLRVYMITHAVYTCRSHEVVLLTCALTKEID